MPEARGIDLVMPTLLEAFPTVCAALAEHFGRAGRHGDRAPPFEAMIGVLLDRELGARRAALAIEALAGAGLVSVVPMAEADVLEIRNTLLEKGVPASAQSVAPLKNLARWIVEHHGGRVDSLFNPDRSTDWLRGELAAIRGIGLAAADAILLFALERPSYPVDRATFRVLVRHDWLDPDASYDETRDLLVEQAVQQGLVPDGLAANRLIGLAQGMGALGRRLCRAAAPKCDGCPLEGLLPDGGPREVDG